MKLRLSTVLTLLFALALGSLWATAATAAASGLVERPHIQVELVSLTDSVQPGGEARVGLRLVPETGWHTYWKNPGDSGLATTLEWRLPPGVSASEINWPYPDAIPFAHLINYGYNGEHLLPVTLSIPASVKAGEALKLEARADWLVCEEICIPGDATMVLELPVSAAPPVRDESVAGLFAWADQRRPEPVDWPARFSTDGGQLSVQVENATLADAQGWAFFSEDNNLVDHSGAPVLGAAEGQLLISQPLSPFTSRLPEQLRFVLVDGQAGKGYRLQARVDELVSTGKPAETAPPGQLPVTWLAALGLALLGGLLLNLMPCVFPVLSIKALSLVGAGGSDQRGHGLAYTAGVMVSFAVLAGVLLALRAAGDVIGWGFQLQSPWIVGVLIYVLFALGLSLSGLFEFGGALMNAGRGLTARTGLAGSFFTGVLACVVASPCTAPFMGAALGAAVLMPWPLAITVFLALGFGLALPILLFSFVPALAGLLPRPGPWMVTFKQFMAFPLYLAVVWLLWVLARQTDADGLAAVLVGLVALSFSLWLVGRGRADRPPSWPQRGAVAAGLVAALLALASAAHVDSEPVEAAGAWWEEYSPDRLAALRADPEVAVFVNMTADWCLTCKVNETVALNQASVRQAMAARGVVYMKGDWTRRNEAITAYLSDFDRNGVPLYVAYPRDGGDPQLLPQVLTPGMVIGVIESL